MNRTMVDSYVQSSRQAGWISLGVDNSASMFEEQEQLAEHTALYRLSDPGTSRFSIWCDYH